MAVTSPAPADTSPTGEGPVLRPWVSWLLIGSTGLAIWLAALEYHPQRPPELDPGWRLLAVFVPTILALMLRPIPGGAAVLLGLLVAVLTGALELGEALGGYADKTVWLVLAAYFIARALIKTGLARRIALTFVRLLGRNPLGLSYAVVASDTVLAGLIPSNAARVGGVLLPITRNLAELYQSYPGRTAGLLGSFLMLTLYQGDVVACALFITGQASNWLAAEIATNILQQQKIAPVEISYATWFRYALLPAAASLLLLPCLVYRLNRPAIAHTPEAIEFARMELAKMGRPKFGEWVVSLVFLGVCTLWVLDRQGANTTLIALGGVGVLLLSGVLTWEDAITERGAWDVFIWYGGLVQLGKKLHEAGLIQQFAEAVHGALGGWPLVPLFLVVLLIHFYAHYAFASITTHMVSMYPAFVAVLLVAGAPPALVVFCFAYFTNFSAGLTHYGTTPAPIIFSIGYIPQRTWWRVGFQLSLVNVTIWLTLGMLWWKLLGLW